MMRSDAQRRKGLSLPNPMDFLNSIDGLVDSVMGIVYRYELVSVQPLVPQCLSRGVSNFRQKTPTPHRQLYNQGSNSVRFFTTICWASGRGSIFVGSI